MPGLLLNEMKQRHKGKKSKDTCSCWACRSEKYRTTRQTTITHAFSVELNMGYYENDKTNN